MSEKKKEEDGKRQFSYSRKRHIGFFRHCLQVLPSHYEKQEVNRLTLTYFVYSGLDVLGVLQQCGLDAATTVDWIYNLQVRCSEEDGYANAGFRGSPFFGYPFDAQRSEEEKGDGHKNHPYDQGHLAMTYCALSLLAMLGDDYSRVDKTAIVKGLRELQNEDGSFSPVSGGSESDMRFVYCAVAISYILNDFSGLNMERTLRYIQEAQNYDGGFGQGSGRESHGGSTYCAVASLVLLGKLDAVPDRERLVHWLVQRQVTGFQGRVNKPADACYAFWIGSTLRFLGAFELVNVDFLKGFILSCEAKDIGGFGKHPSTHPDVLHTYYSLVGLSYCAAQGLSDVHVALSITERAYEQIEKNREKAEK